MVLVPERIVQTLQVKFGLRDTQDMIKKNLFAAPFQPGLLRCLIRSVLEGGPKFAKKLLSVGVLFGGYAADNSNNSHLLMIMYVRIS